MKLVQHVTAVIEREGGGYVALCPELDIASQGNTIEEARQNLGEALELFCDAASIAEVSERLRVVVRSWEHRDSVARPAADCHDPR